MLLLARIRRRSSNQPAQRYAKSADPSGTSPKVQDARYLYQKPSGFDPRGEGRVRGMKGFVAISIGFAFNEMIRWGGLTRNFVGFLGFSSWPVPTGLADLEGLQDAREKEIARAMISPGATALASAGSGLL
jgi:hypothetical protein